MVNKAAINQCCISKFGNIVVVTFKELGYFADTALGYKKHMNSNTLKEKTKKNDPLFFF